MASSKRKIPPAQPAPEDKHLEFSFNHLDMKHTRFSFASQLLTAEFFKCLFVEISRYQASTVGDFREVLNDDSKRHPIYFGETSEPEGFTCLKSEELQSEEGWQLALAPGEHSSPESGWRVYGFLVQEIFYIVWLDPFHHLYPSGKYRAES